VPSPPWSAWGLLAARRITLRSQICFGPFLLDGALVAVLAIG
jgi:hypothetical protein